MSRAVIAIIGTYCLVPLFCTPIYFCFTIQTFTANGALNATLYKVRTYFSFVLSIRVHSQYITLLDF